MEYLTLLGLEREHFPRSFMKTIEKPWVEWKLQVFYVQSANRKTGSLLRAALVN
jgi:hypothetical protein